MNSLREIVDFVGIPQGSLASARYQFSGPWTMGLHNVNLLVTKGAKPASMRNIIQILRNLTPITLEAEIVGSRSGEEPFNPVIRVNASGGITWFTTYEYRTGGSVDLNSAGGDFTPIQLGPGNYQPIVKRSGISNTGFVSLSKNLGAITVSARPQPPTPDIPPVKPFITVQSKGDGSFVVSGSKFLPNTPVFILVGDGTIRNPLVLSNTSDPEGNFFEFPTGKICQGPGQLFFEANDGRLNPSDRSTLMSNTVTVSCPF